MELKLSFEIEMEDLQSFQNEHLSNIDFVKKSALKAGVLYGALLIIFFMLYLKGFVAFEDFIIPTVFLISYFIYYTTSIRKRMMNSYKIQLSTKSLKNLVGTYEIIFKEDDFTVNTKYISSIYKYEAIVHKGESDTHLFLYSSALGAVLIPKKKVENQIFELMDLLKVKIEN